MAHTVYRLYADNLLWAMGRGKKMKNDIQVFLLAVFIVGLILFVSWKMSSENYEQRISQKDFCFIKADVLFGKIPPGTAEVRKSFEKYRGYWINWNGKFYIISRIANRDHFHPRSIRLPGNELVKYKNRFVPVFKNKGIEDRIKEE